MSPGTEKTVMAPQEFHSRLDKLDKELRRQDGHEVPAPIRRHGRKTGRNELCPCNSGRKFKKCCLVLAA